MKSSFSQIAFCYQYAKCEIPVLKEYDITGHKLAAVETPICVEASAHYVTSGSDKTSGGSVIENVLELLVNSSRDLLYDSRVAEQALNILGRMAFNLGRSNCHQSEQP